VAVTRGQRQGRKQGQHRIKLDGSVKAHIRCAGDHRPMPVDHAQDSDGGQQWKQTEAELQLDALGNQGGNQGHEDQVLTSQGLRP
jgi:hypothetical protein